MARMPRLYLEGCAQHIEQLSNNRSAYFLSATDYAFYCQKLKNAADENGVQVHAFVTPATPNKLSWSTPKADVCVPLASPNELQAALDLNPFPHYSKLALAGDADPGLISQATLETKQGNALDTASLLIA